MIRAMNNVSSAVEPRNYRIGIDVGSYSLGLCAVEFDESSRPAKILSATSWLHDSGVLEEKTGTTRLAASGVARRMRRLRRRRIKRLVELDRAFTEWSWPEPEESTDPYAPWRARARLASEFIADEEERQQLLVLALRHLARHRGWRNPYTHVSVMQRENEPSELFTGFRTRVEEALQSPFPDGVTVAQLAVAALDSDERKPLRMGKAGRARPGKQRSEKAFSFLGGKLMQSDNANEIHAYARVQRLDPSLVRRIIELVFVAVSPRGSHIGKIGKDPFDDQPRASKATDAFQRFRIASVLANVRVSGASGPRPLTVGERQGAYSFLVNVKAGEQPTWAEVAKAIELSRSALAGTASLDEEGVERLPLRPPVYVTDHVFRQAPAALKRIRDWWGTASSQARDALVVLLVDGHIDEASPEGMEAWELLNELSDEEMTSLEKLALPAGRGAYSLRSLHKLTERILSSDCDLHNACKVEFGVDDFWRPPAEPIGAPIGNPSVDRVTKLAARWLLAAEREWGAPSQITIEHVRDAFVSAKSQQERDREMRKRYEENERRRLAIKSDEKIDARIRIEDVRRYEAISRQKGQCGYCGETITYTTSEMDHIVPRKGVGSTNTRSNLMAVCIACNRSKGNQPFAAWASSSVREGVSVEKAIAQTHHWTREKGVSPKGWLIFLKEVRERLARTDSDAEIDGRSMESVAWMANELRERIAAHFAEANTKVSVYQGAVTAGAREAAGIAGQIPFIGGGGKTRLDRRHHAVDAAVLTLLDESIGRTLAERNNLRASQGYDPDPAHDWKAYSGSGATAQRRFADWRLDMERLAELLIDAFVNDRVVVRNNFRLRLGNGKVHDDTVRPFTVHRAVGDAHTRDQIDAASSPAMWTALSRDPDFDPVEGLPANPSRMLRIHGTHYGPQDRLDFFDKPRAALAVRGGWAELGDSIHHVRIYRWQERGKTKYGMLRVFAFDLYKHRHEDLFQVEPDPSWVSMRVAHPSIGRADLSEKEYLGWLVPGDELLIDMSQLLDGHVGRFCEAFGLSGRQRWKVTGFMSATQVSLSPLVVSREGLASFFTRNPEAEPVLNSIEYVFRRWICSVDVLLGRGRPMAIRRDTLGRPRLESHSNLPVCWKVK